MVKEYDVKHLSNDFTVIYSNRISGYASQFGFVNCTFMNNLNLKLVKEKSRKENKTYPKTKTTKNYKLRGDQIVDFPNRLF